jgi:polyhydroxyalkanoate synthesis regulator phasin
MANHCSNLLKVSQTNTSKESAAQLRKFIDDICNKGEKLTTKEAKAFRDNFLKEQFENRYSNNAALFVEHSEMPLKNFMERVAYYTYDKDNKTFTTDYSALDLGKILPAPNGINASLPQGISEKEEKKILEERKLQFGGFSNSYDWVVANWGTRWVDCDDICEDNGNYITYSFTSAWAPPVEFFKNICEDYPLLDFSLNYEEPGCAFEGDLEIVAGEVTLDEIRDWVQKTCNCCGEELNDGEEFDDNGNCPYCAESEED